MGASGVTELYIPGHGRVHRLAPHPKILAAVCFILLVVVTPREQLWAFALYGGLVVALVRTCGLPVRTWLTRLSIEVPFVAFAVLLPFLAGGRTVDVGPLALSASGLWAAWNILAKATIGVTVSIVLTATTPMTDLIRGLDALRVPRVVTSIMTFMVRYAEVLAAEAHRMHVARLSRAQNPRWIWQARTVAQSAGALFLRAYERGERVHVAMLSRGYDGAMPILGAAAAPRRDWAVAAALPAVAAVVAAGAFLVAP